MSLEIGQEWLLYTTPFKLKETTAPTAAEVPGNTLAFYAKDNGAGISTLCYKNDAGTEVCLPTVGPLVTGSGVTNQVAIWGGTSVLIGDTGLIFDPSTDALTVAGSLTSNSLTAGRIVFSGASGLLSDSSKFLYDSTNNVLTIGGGAGGFTSNRSIDLLGTGTEALASVIRQTANGVNNFSNFQGRMSRGTAGTPTAAQADDLVTRLSLIQYGATNYAAGARASVDLVAGENATDTAHGTYIKFQTTSLLSTTLTERFRVGPAGQWGIGGATFGTLLDVFTSGGASTGPTWTTPGALTKVDDTNVTLTLGGTPTTALLRAASLTLGWTGTLGVVRGGTNIASYAVGDLLYASTSTTLAKLSDVAVGSYLRSGGVTTAPLWSTLILPNAATANRVVYATGTNTYGESADVTYDGTDFALGSAKRFRMQSQNRTRYLNSTASVKQSGNQTGITVNVWTALAFGAEIFDTDGIHSNVTNNSRLTLPLVGKWAIWGAIYLDFAGITTPAQVGIRFQVNGLAGGSNDILGYNLADAGTLATTGGIGSSAIIVTTAITDYVELFGIVTGAAGTWAASDVYGGLTNFGCAYIGE